MTKTFINTITEGRFWITVLGTLAVTQGGAALVVPQTAEQAAEERVDGEFRKTKSATLTTAEAINDHADHIEELQARFAEHEDLWNKERDSLKSQIGELSGMIDVLLDILERQYGRSYVERYVSRRENNWTRPPDEPGTNVARVEESADPVRRLPTSFEEILEKEEVTP